MNKPVFSKLEVAPAYRQVFDAIEQQILAGKLRPGDRLPSEIELANQFGVNRSTVREGIRLLEHSGLVGREGGKRLTVSLPHYRELASRATRALVMHQVTFRELWEASMALEPVTAFYAATRIGKEDLAALERNVEAMATDLQDIERVVALDIEFHDLIAKAAENKALILAREPIGLLFHPAGRVILPRLGTQKRILDAHRSILALLRERKAEAARDWMTRHMADFMRGYKRTGVSMDAALDLAQVSGG